MPDFLTIDALSKNYANGFEALKTINLRVEEAEILALLGPNGAGKTTLISTICGISKFTSGKITLAGHDIVQNYRAARKMIGMVPQELSLESFETVMNTLRFSRGL
nr:ATP-binding cassette domain-containing protein [Candidatus Neomarinimicrobiota bacterium]